MAVPRPGKDDLALIANSYGMQPTDEKLAALQPIISQFLESYDVVEQLYAEIAPSIPDGRAANRPTDADNPLGAWSVTTDIVGPPGGPLTGYRVAIKDNTAVAGVPMMNGSATLAGFVPARDATVVSRLLDAGATIAGKAVCEDLCFSGGSHTSVTGPVLNPWDTTRTTGGSSSGSAALVAAGAVDVALGGDQAGSVRIPSAFCGTVGHKPTSGLVPYTGAFPIEMTIDHLGPIARTVTDAAVMLSVIAGRDGHDPRQPADVVVDDYIGALDQDVAGMRVGVVREGFGFDELSDPAVDEAVRAAVFRLREAGMYVEEIDLPSHRQALHVWNVIGTDGATVQMIDGNGYGHNWDGLYDPELIDFFGRQRREVADRWSPSVTAVCWAGRWSAEQMHTRHYAMARNLVPVIRRHYDDALASFDVLAMPTLPMTAPKLVSPTDSIEMSVKRSLEMIVNTAPFNVTGHPAISVPAGLVGGLPTGLMLVGNRFADATCLRVARAWEKLSGGFPVPTP